MPRDKVGPSSLVGLILTRSSLINCNLFQFGFVHLSTAFIDNWFKRHRIKFASVPLIAFLLQFSCPLLIFLVKFLEARCTRLPIEHRLGTSFCLFLIEVRVIGEDLRFEFTVPDLEFLSKFRSLFRDTIFFLDHFLASREDAITWVLPFVD